MYKNQILGQIGENLAMNYLLKKQYEIIGKNFRCKSGEIDVIAIKGEYLVFIEVKTRSNARYGIPSEAVTKQKRKHIYKTAKYYLYINHIEHSFVRFDVIEIYVVKNKFRINHIKQIIWLTIENYYVVNV